MAPRRKAEPSTGAHERRGTLAFKERRDPVPIQVSDCAFDPGPLPSLELEVAVRHDQPTPGERHDGNDSAVVLPGSGEEPVPDPTAGPRVCGHR